MTIIDWLFGCSHSNLSRPFTIKGCKAAKVTGTYRVCLDCGREFPYCLRTMRKVSAKKHEPENLVERYAEVA